MIIFPKLAGKWITHLNGTGKSGRFLPFPTALALGQRLLRCAGILPVCPLSERRSVPVYVYQNASANLLNYAS